MALSFKFSPQKSPRSLSLLLIIAVFALSLVLLTFRGTLPTLTEQASSLTIRSATAVGALHQPTIARCFLYDRPMRTGSTTITSALRKCIKAHGWAIAAQTKEGEFHNAITNSLRVSEGDSLGIMQHLWISDADVRALYSRCDRVVYISSCAKLSDQLWSAAKMLSNVRKNGNSTLDDDKTAAALQWLRDYAAPYARMYEFYPHIRTQAPLKVQEDGRFPDVPPSFERASISLPFQPDFVIRKEHMETDLADLLTALNCSSSFRSKNVHAVSESDADAEDTLMAKVRDASHAADGVSYTRLMQIANERNPVGLEKIRDMASSI